MSHTLPLFLAYAPAAPAPTHSRPQGLPGRTGRAAPAGGRKCPACWQRPVGGRHCPRRSNGAGLVLPPGTGGVPETAGGGRPGQLGGNARWASPRPGAGRCVGETPPVLHRSGSLCPIGSQRTGADLLPALRRNAAGADTGSAGTVWFSCSAGAGVQSVCLCPPLSGRAGHDADPAGVAEAVRPPSVSGVVLGGFLLPVCHLSGDGAAPFDLV